MAWLDLDDFTFLPTRTSADKYSAADMNSVDDNLTQLRDDLALIVGANTQPTRDIATLESDLATAEGEIDTLQTDVSALGIPYTRNGLTLSNAADTDHDITVAAGKCSSSAFDTMLVLASAMTKQIDASWSVGTNAGGLFSGSVANSTWYYVHIIRKDSDGSIDIGFDTSITAANKPAGYTYYRRIGSVITDGSANIRNFFQYGNRFFLKTLVLSWTTNNPGTNAVLDDVICPPSMMAIVSCTLKTASHSARVYALFSSPLETDSAPSSSLYNLTVREQYASSTDGEWNTDEKEIVTDSSSRIRYRLDTSSTDITVDVFSKGWIDDGI